MVKARRDTYPEIERLAGRLSSIQIAARLGINQRTVTSRLRRIGRVSSGPTHPAARRYAGRPLPAQPDSIDDDEGEHFGEAVEQTYQVMADQYGMTKQGVGVLVRRVLAAIDAGD